jgi:hypothetical protein
MRRSSGATAKHSYTSDLDTNNINSHEVAPDLSGQKQNVRSFRLKILRQLQPGVTVHGCAESPSNPLPPQPPEDPVSLAPASVGSELQSRVIEKTQGARE